MRGRGGLRVRQCGARARPPRWSRRPAFRRPAGASGIPARRPGRFPHARPRLRARPARRPASWAATDGADGAISSADFTMRSCSIQPATGSSEAFSGSCASQESHRHRRSCAPARSRCAANPSRAYRRRTTSGSSGPLATILTRQVASSRRLDLVARIGEQDRARGRPAAAAVAAGEAGQVAQVGAEGHQQRIQLALRPDPPNRRGVREVSVELALPATLQLPRQDQGALGQCVRLPDIAARGGLVGSASERTRCA